MTDLLHTPSIVYRKKSFMKKFIFLPCIAFCLTIHFAGAQDKNPDGWEQIKHIEETSIYVPADRAVEHHPEQPNWRTFRMLLNDTDIAPNSIIITVTLDCASKSMRSDQFDIYDAVDGKGQIIQSTPAASSEFVPMNDELAPASKTYEIFCQP